MSIYDLKVKTRDGKDFKLSELKGKVLLVVNTATGCGFTPQYEGLENLYEKYHDKGLEVLDFPCNQFGHQAPGDDNEIHSFCTAKYKTQFDQFAKIDVNGENEIPLYALLKKAQPKEEPQGICGEGCHTELGRCHHGLYSVRAYSHYPGTAYCLNGGAYRGI